MMGRTNVARTPSSGRFSNLTSSLVQHRHLFNDVESEARAFFPAVGALERKEFVKNFLQGEIGDSRAVIFDHELQIVDFDPPGQLDRSVDGAEIDGVLNQIGECLKEQESISAQIRRSLST